MADGQPSDPLARPAAPAPVEFVPQMDFQRSLVPEPADPFQPRPDAGAILGAAFREANPIASVLHAISGNRDDFFDDPTHNPVRWLRENAPKYTAGNLKPFLGSRNEYETRSIMARMDAEEQDKQTLAMAGGWGTAASIAAGLLDPTMFIPIAGVAGKGYSVSRTALSLGAGFGLQSAASETLLQASQLTRTTSESLGNIATATILGGLLGAAGAKYLSRVERKALEDAFEIDRSIISREMAAAEGAQEANIGLGRSVGAMEADTREIALKPFLGGALDYIPAPVREKLSFLSDTSPTLRTLKSQNVEVRRASADLVENVFRFTDAETGQVTTAGGIPLERLAKMQKTELLLQATDDLKSNWIAHRYEGDAPSGVQKFTDQVSDVLGQGPAEKLNYNDFKKEVTRALMNGDQHAIAEVQNAAQSIRRNVLDPTQKWLQEIGLLPKELAVKGDPTWFARNWNKQAMAANPEGFLGPTTKWLADEQTLKREAQSRMTAAFDKIEVLQRRLDDIEAKIARARSEDARAKLGGEAKQIETEIAALRDQLENELKGWNGRSAEAAQAAMAKREATSAERPAGAVRLKGADGEVDKAVRRIIESDRDLSQQELRARAEEIYDRVMGGPDGRLAYDAASYQGAKGFSQQPENLRGSLKSRDFAIPTNLVFDFVEHDAEHSINRLLNTVLPDGMLVERFGDVEMSAQFRKINDEYHRLLEGAKTEKERTALRARHDRDVGDLAAMRDRVRGIYAVPTTTVERSMATWAGRAKQFSSITDLGTAALNSMPDLAGVTFRYGLENTFRDAWEPFISGLVQGGSEFTGAAMRQAKDMKIAVEVQMNLRNHQLADVLENYRPNSKFDRGLAFASDKMQLANGQAHFTDIAKTLAATVVSADILRSAERVAAGKATQKEITALAERNISAENARRIWGEFQDGGGKVIDGTPISETGMWKDRGTRNLFEAAVAREVDIAVVTPGAERPLFMSNPILGMLTQFKGFIAATHERTVLAQMQQMDGRTLSGLMSSVAFGILSYRLYTIVTGKEFDTNPSHLIKEGISRGGTLGWFDEANSIAAKSSGGRADVFRLIGADKPLSRMESRGILGTFAGPIGGKLEGAASVTRGLSTGEWTAAETSAARRLIPFQNLFYLRNLLNEAEAGFNNAIGVAPKPAPKPPASFN